MGNTKPTSYNAGHPGFAVYDETGTAIDLQAVKGPNGDYGIPVYTISGSNGPGGGGGGGGVVTQGTNPWTISGVVSHADSTVQGTITAGGSISIATAGFNTVGVYISNTWSGTILFEGSVDGINYTSTSGLALATGSLANSTTGNGTFQILCAGLATIRLRGNTVTNTAAIYLRASYAVASSMLDNPIPAGNNVIGQVTANQGAAALPAGAWPVEISDGVHNATVETSGALDVTLLDGAGHKSVMAANGELLTNLRDSAGHATGIEASGSLDVIGKDVSGHLQNFNADGSTPVTGTFWQTTQPVSAASLPLPAGAATSANQTSMITDLDYRYSGGKTAFATTTGASGNINLITPAAGHLIRVFWISFVPSSDNANANLLKIGFGTTGGAISTELYRGYAMAHWEVFNGATNQSLIANLASTEPVAITVHYQEI